jgi:hypothetical protein
MKVEVDGVNTILLHAFARCGHGLRPQSVKTGDPVPVFVYPVVEPKEYIGASRGRLVSHLPLVSNERLNLAHIRCLTGTELGGFEIDASLLEIHSVPAKVEKFAQPSADILGQHEEAAQRRMQQVTENAVVTVWQSHPPGVLPFRPLVKIATASRHRMNLAELDADFESFADFGEIAIDRGVGNLLSPAVFTESLAVCDGQF